MEALVMDNDRFGDETYIQELKRQLKEKYNNQIEAKKENYSIYICGVASGMRNSISDHQH
jgi:hypothetical protein